MVQSSGFNLKLGLEPARAQVLSMAKSIDMGRDARSVQLVYAVIHHIGQGRQAR